MQNKLDENIEIDTEDFFAENEITKPKKISTKQKFLNFCKKFITFLVSRIGLSILMVCLFFNKYNIMYLCNLIIIFNRLDML